MKSYLLLLSALISGIHAAYSTIGAEGSAHAQPRSCTDDSQSIQQSVYLSHQPHLQRLQQLEKVHEMEAQWGAPH